MNAKKGTHKAEVKISKNRFVEIGEIKPEAKEPGLGDVVGLAIMACVLIRFLFF